MNYKFKKPEKAKIPTDDFLEEKSYGFCKSIDTKKAIYVLSNGRFWNYIDKKIPTDVSIELHDAIDLALCALRGIENVKEMEEYIEYQNEKI